MSGYEDRDRGYCPNCGKDEDWYNCSECNSGICKQCCDSEDSSVCSLCGVLIAEEEAKES